MTFVIHEYSFTEILLCYNVITNIMPRIFQSRIRKIGNSLGLIIPGDVIRDQDIHKGDEINVMIPSLPMKDRNDRIRDIIGAYEGRPKFERDKGDRF